MQSVLAPQTGILDFGISIARLSWSAAILAFIILLSLFWMAGAPIPAEARYASIAMIFSAGLVLFARGANDLSPATWIVLLAAYPVLVPLLTLDVLGFPAFATGSRAHQSIQAITVPTLIGASGTLFLALCLSVRQISLPARAVLLRRNVALSGGTAVVLFLSAAVCFFAVDLIDAPFETLQLGQVSYRDLKGERDDTLNAASGLVMIFGALSAMALIGVQGAQGLSLGMRRVCTVGFALLTTLIASWQILAASRIEVVGLLLLIYLLFAHRLHGLVRLIFVLAAVSALALVGYFRTLVGLLAYLSRDFISWPGGVENVFNTYVFGLNAVRDGTLQLQLGQTYLNLIERLPPQIFGLDRPDRAYDIAAAHTHLIGGEYYLFEPFLNYLGFGVAVALVAVVWGINRAIHVLRSFLFDGRGYASALISLVMFTVCFRMLWYGLEHTVKVLLLTAILSLPLTMLENSRKSMRTQQFVPWFRRRQCVQRGL